MLGAQLARVRLSRLAGGIENASEGCHKATGGSCARHPSKDEQDHLVIALGVHGTKRQGLRNAPSRSTKAQQQPVALARGGVDDCLEGNRAGLG